MSDPPEDEVNACPPEKLAECTLGFHFVQGREDNATAPFVELTLSPLRWLLCDGRAGPKL